VYCTPGRSKKVVVTLAVVALTSQVIVMIDLQLSGSAIVLLILVQHKRFCLLRGFTVTVLVMSRLVVCAVRRASNNAAANLGQQSTSSSSAVPILSCSSARRSSIRSTMRHVRCCLYCLQVHNG